MGKALEPFVCGNSVDLMLEDGPVRATGGRERVFARAWPIESYSHSMVLGGLELMS